MLDGVEITVGIKRPSGVVSTEFRLDEMVWSGLGSKVRDDVVMQTIATAGRECLQAMLKREEES